MTQHSTHPAADSPDFDDLELEQLLCDAYEAPEVPRSLARRVRRDTDREWQTSGGSDRRAVVRMARSMRSHWGRTVPAVAGIAAALLVAFFILPSSGSAWAAMLEAVAERGVVQLTGPEGTRWLSLSAGVLGERTPHTLVLIDLEENYSLLRSSGDTLARRRPIALSGARNAHEQLMVAFLTGRTDGSADLRRLAGLRLAEERWKSVRQAGRKLGMLEVRFETDLAETITLQLLVDPETHLPLACDSPTGDDLTLSYPATSVSQMRDRDFPATLVVVEAEESDQGLTRAADDLPGEDVRQAAAGNPSTDRQVPADPADEASAEADVPEPIEAFSGVPSAWKPVAYFPDSSPKVVREIDEVLAELWQREGVEPVEPASDEELLRRVYLDLAGRTPSVSEARAYLNDPSSDRYPKLVDRLLASPDHASHLATVWRTFLIPEGIDLAAFGGIEAFDRWLAQRFASDDAYDEVVRNLLLAEGRLSRSGPLLFYSALKLDPDQIASRTSRVFLGMRLECAQCHDHPFEPWTQEDFWGFAAFFAQISRPQAELETVSTVMQVRDVDRGEVMLPETDTTVAPAFLDRSSAGEGSRQQARRQQLAEWLTSAKNPYFARATANRAWGHLFGRGIVDPVDDFGTQNKPLSPKLLDLLAGHFIAQGFDLNDLFRVIVLSKAYQLSSGAATADEKRLETFAQMNVKMLTAEQMYDCITVATLLGSERTSSMGLDLVRFGNSRREEFLRQFRTPAGGATEYQGGIPQALTLMNGTLIADATGLSSSGILKSLEAPFFTNEQRVEVLYLATLSRRPRPAEWERLRSFLPEDASATEVQETLADILWALLNSAEFAMNH